MDNLRVANVQKCLSILKEFYEAAAVTDEELREKARGALDHLGMLFHGEPGEFKTGVCPNCGISVQSQTAP